MLEQTIIHVQNGGQVNIALDNGHIQACQTNGGYGSVSEVISQTKYITEMAQKIEEYFIETESYKKALRKLEEGSILVLLGNAGSGKSDCSVMLAKEYGKEYELFLVEGRDCAELGINDVLSKIKTSSNKKEMIIFDDFLGKTVLNSSKTYVDSLNHLIEYVTKNPDKKLILNSRITLFESAKLQNDTFKSYMDYEAEIINITASRNMKDRIEIFTKYMNMYNLQHRICLTVTNEDKLSLILGHENFTPLIIKQVMKYCSKNEEKNLEQSLLEVLDKPHALWDNEVKALNEYARTFLNILYSLSDTWVKVDYVKEAFLGYLKKTGTSYDETFDKTITSLNNLLKYDKYETFERVTFVHPSIMDYIQKELSESEKEKIIKNAVYFEQIERLDKEKKEIRLLFDNVEKFFRLKVLPYTFANSYAELPNLIVVKMLHYIVELNINVEEELIVCCLEIIFEYGRLLLLHSADVVLEALSIKGDFTKFLNNETYMEELFDYLDYEKMWKLVELTCNKTEDYFDFKTFKPYVQHAIEFKLNNAVEDTVNELIQNELGNYWEIYLEGLEEGEEYDCDDATEEIVQSILDSIDFECIATETKVKICEKNHLKNYEELLEKTEIEIDYDFVRDFIIDNS